MRPKTSIGKYRLVVVCWKILKELSRLIKPRSALGCAMLCNSQPAPCRTSPVMRLVGEASLVSMYSTGPTTDCMSETIAATTGLKIHTKPSESTTFNDCDHR
jgi:hypothetical protein